MAHIFNTLFRGIGELLAGRPGSALLLAVCVALAVGIVRRAARQFGATTLMIGIGMILVSGWAMRHGSFLTGYFAASPFGEAEEDEVEAPLETIVLDTANPEALKKQARDLVDRVAVERREKNGSTAKLREAQREIALLRGSLGTEVGKYSTDLSEEGQKDFSSGRCLYCPQWFVMAGNKGRDAVRCPHCGGIMTALAAIQRSYRSFGGY